MGIDRLRYVRVLCAALVLEGLLLAACTGDPSDGTTEPASTSTLPAPTTTTAPPPSTSATSTSSTTTPPQQPLPRPVVALPVSSTGPGAQGGELWTLVASDQGLQQVRADGSTTELVAGAVRAAFTVDARRVVFQRADAAAALELLDVITLRSSALVVGDTDRPVRLEDVAQLGDVPTVLFSRGGTDGVALLRLAVDGGAEQVITTFAPGSTPLELTMSATHVAGIVLAGDEQRAVHLTIGGAPGPAFPEDCATAPCAAWVCIPGADPCRRHVAAAPPVSLQSYSIAFIERRAGEQVVTRADLAIDGTSGHYQGWVPLPAGTVARSLHVVDYRYVIVNTWASTERSSPGRALLVDVLARSTTTIALAGVASSGGIVDHAAFITTPTGADEIVTNRDGLWLLRRGAAPQKLLDERVVFARASATVLLVQRMFDPADPGRALPLLLIDLSAGSTRELFSLDGATGERGLLLTAGQVEGHPEVFYRRAAPAADRTRPAGTVLLYRRALDGSPERAVTSLGVDDGYATNVIQGVHVVGETVFGIAADGATNLPVAFDLEGHAVDHFAGVSYCADEGRCTNTPPVCGGGTACVTHFAVAPDGRRIAWVMMTRLPSGSMSFELVLIDAARGLLSRAPLPNNPSLTLVGGVEWRDQDRMVVQFFALNPGPVSGVVMEGTLRGDALAFASWPFDGSAYPQSYFRG